MSADSTTALIVFAHGSRIEAANDAVRRVASDAAQRCGFLLFTAAFLELATPDLAAAVSDLSERGARRVVVMPYFLTMGVHLSHDLPRLLEEISAQHPGIELRSTPPLDGHPALVDIVSDRALQYLES